MKTPETLQLECYKTIIFDFNKIDFREREAKIFKKKLQKAVVDSLPQCKFVVVTMKARDLSTLFDTDKIILN